MSASPGPPTALGPVFGPHPPSPHDLSNSLYITESHLSLLLTRITVLIRRRAPNQAPFLRVDQMYPWLLEDPTMAYWMRRHGYPHWEDGNYRRAVDCLLQLAVDWVLAEQWVQGERLVEEDERRRNGRGL